MGSHQTTGKVGEALSQRAYADSRKQRRLPGGTLHAVQKAIKSGRIHLVDGRIDPAAADRSWDQRAAPDSITRRSSAQLAAAPRDQAQPVGSAKENQGRKPPGLGGGSPPSILEQFQAARAQREATRAREAALDLLEREGSLVDAGEEFERDAARAAIFKEHMLNFASEFAPRIAAALKVDERRLYNELDRAQREHLFQIAQAFEPQAQAAA